MPADHITPPFKLGHSEKQALLKGEGLPAAGRVTNCWNDKGTFMVTGENVPVTLRDAINNKAYYKCSVEIYDDPPDEIKEVLKKNGSEGKVLRAIALLGEDLPRVKSLKDLPALYKETGSFSKPIEAFKAGVKNDDGIEYSQKDIDDITRNFHILKAAGVDPSKFTEKKHKVKFTRLFYEPTRPTQGDDTMDAAAIRKMLEEKGISPDVLKMLDDNALLAFVDVCKGTTTDSDEPKETEDEKKAREAKEAEAAKNAETAKNGEKPMTYAEVQKAIKEGIANGMKVAMTAFSEEGKKVGKTLSDASSAAVAAIEKTATQAKLSSFSEVVEKCTNAGLPPAISDGGKLQFIAETLLASKTAKKFGEKEMTAYDVFVRHINDIPALMPKKGEKGAVLGAGSKTDFEEHKKTEVEKVKATFSKYSETFINSGVTEKEMVDAYEKQLKVNPKLTALEHLGVE